ncbi:MAG TPA: hypothetical protein VNI84_21590 [Pyrinomonadaceae bacterium]|nr:hypothetical protein [Pyrinomonadaceae bacterium]
MKTLFSKVITFSLIIAVLAAMPKVLTAQNQVVGELTITKNSPEDYVLVNGERAVSGRSITSPSDIVTSPGATARLVIPQTGTISIAPNSKLNLSFVNSSIAGDFLAGEVTIETAPNTAINLFPPDGTITTPNRGQVNAVKVSTANGATRVDTLKGEVLFNIVLVSAGESYSPATNSRTTANADDSGGYNPLLIFGILGAVAGAVIIALSASSNDNDNPTVSPTR